MSRWIVTEDRNSDGKIVCLIRRRKLQNGRTETQRKPCGCKRWKTVSVW